MTELLVRHLAVMGTAWLLSLALRNRSAALRHALWTLALAACLLLPVLQHVPLALPAQLASPMGVGGLGPAAIAGEPAATLTASVAPLPRSGLHWATLVWCFYIATALTLALRWFLGWQKAVRLARSGKRVGSVRGIPVIAVDGVGPLAFGWPRGVIIVPHADLARHEMVMRHELAHIQRADFLWQAVGTLACALWWFSPAVWLALRALRREAEHACDDRVLAAGTSAADYADGLLEVAAMQSRRLTHPAAAVPLIRDTDLGRRVAAVLAPARDRRAAGPLAVAGLALLVLPAALHVSRPVVAGEAAGMATLVGKRIALDPGHGGKDPGAAVGGLREADVNLAIVQRAKTLFERAGAEVLLTRDGDEFVQLRQRAALSADHDLFLSVHVGATGSEQGGSRPATIRVYYFDADDTTASEDAAKLAGEIVAHAGTRDGAGDFGRQIARASFVVLGQARSPAFMVEVGDLSSEEDRARLRDPALLQALARGLVEGAAAVLSSLPPEGSLKLP